MSTRQKWENWFYGLTFQCSSKQQQIVTAENIIGGMLDALIRLTGDKNKVAAFIYESYENLVDKIMKEKANDIH